MRSLGGMAEIEIDGSAVTTPHEFYEAFFAATTGLVPDYGGRNADALNDDLRGLMEPLTVTIRHVRSMRDWGGEFLYLVVDVFLDREPGNKTVRVVLDPN